MKKLFYAGAMSLIFFEIANVYFIMPMYGSQEIPSIDIAYFLYASRWFFRVMFGLMALIGFVSAFKSTYQYAKYLSSLILVLTLGIMYITNFQMAADSMFLQPQLTLRNAENNAVKSNKLIIGVALNGEAKAYPIQFLGYHHQIVDTIDNQQIMVTYCTVCRTGRIFQPIINGKIEQFRLVGMDHFNAMFEDKTTKSWWQQATGTAITGTLKGQQLPEIFSQQMSLEKWLVLHPNSLIMQPDSIFKEAYADMDSYDVGKGRGQLTGTDSISWNRKSWVVGIEIGQNSKAYDWNRLIKERVINDFVGDKPIVLAVAADNKSFVAYERFSQIKPFSIQHDTLIIDNQYFTFDGKAIDITNKFYLKPIKAHQEFWHSWLNFHPKTLKY
jgi:hypothetical protein